ncbi:hypothetical protein [Halanaerobacter jeridensis]|uniref:Uncharacterized protein YutE (UPF0331/DUF86 family) n=1 Tax=Halanaerobacter jeridensis TaxID=706427 RepID=A0A938XUK1_9FIRM|nr:hypothetical protein [Halanaerobacter jeridensis]MBM7558179.1 uncharacterized protein YutE (UPF0331/DUF86 family) [Halanaerobacter jeridensis]
MFSNIDRNVKNAFVQKRNQSLDSIFETELKHKIHTVNFNEAIERVTKICGYNLSEVFSNKLIELQDLRNQVTHSEIHFDEIEIQNLFDGFLEELEAYFYDAIGDKYKTVTGYSQLVKNYENYVSILEDKNLKEKKEILDCFLEIFDSIGFGMGLNEVKLITDINIATKIISSIINSDFKLGLDLYNGFCSGDILEIKRIDKNHFSILTNDDNSEYIFKFKGLLIYMPSLHSKYSPILYFEADNDICDEYSKEELRCFRDGIKAIEGIYLYEKDETMYGFEEVNKFHNEYNSTGYMSTPKYHTVHKFLTKGIFCFINFQTLKYRQVVVSLRDWKFEDLKALEVAYRKTLK